MGLKKVKVAPSFKEKKLVGVNLAGNDYWTK